MADYFLTKSTHHKTGELPDLVVIDLSSEQAWTMAYELLMQLRSCNPRITINFYCQLIRAGKTYNEKPG